MQLNAKHVAYTILDRNLKSCEVWTVDTAIKTLAEILSSTPGLNSDIRTSIHEAETQDVIRIMFDIRKVRELTGKYPASYISPALGILNRHRAPRERDEAPAVTRVWPELNKRDKRD